MMTSLSFKDKSQSAAWNGAILASTHSSLHIRPNSTSALSTSAVVHVQRTVFYFTLFEYSSKHCFTELNWKHFTILSCMNFEFWNLYGTSFTQLHCSSPCFMNITYSVYTVYTILYTEPSIQTAHFLPKISLIRTLHLLAYSPTMAPPPPHTELTAFCTVHIAPPPLLRSKALKN